MLFKDTQLNDTSGIVKHNRCEIPIFGRPAFEQIRLTKNEKLHTKKTLVSAC